MKLVLFSERHGEHKLTKVTGPMEVKSKTKQSKRRFTSAFQDIHHLNICYISSFFIDSNLLLDSNYYCSLIPTYY